MVMALRIVGDQDSAIRGTLASALVALAKPKLTPGAYLAAHPRGGAIITRGETQGRLRNHHRITGIDDMTRSDPNLDLVRDMLRPHGAAAGAVGRPSLAVFAGMRAFAMFVVRVVRRLHATQVARVAASLSFTTLLGVVPLFTVAFAYVAPYSMFEHWREALEPVLLKFLLPGSGTSARQYLAEFTAKTAGSQGHRHRAGRADCGAADR